MATVELVVGAPHLPFHFRSTRAAREDWPEDTIRMADLGEMMAHKIRQARPDALLVVANDHLHQFFMDNMPQFLIGKMERYDGVFYNEVREFGMEPCTIPGDPTLAGELLEGGIQRRVDFSFSDELKLDHAVVTPLLHLGLCPRLDIPIVPLLTNCLAPPLPSARRFYEVGQALRDVIADVSSSARLAVVASGNLSLEVGGPRQFAPMPVDETFDDQVTEYISSGRADKLIDYCSFDRMTQAGNVTHAVTNFVLSTGIAEGFECTYAEAMKRKGTTQPWYAWEPRR